jgi:hypothetical protein
MPGRESPTPAGGYSSTVPVSSPTFHIGRCSIA